MEDYFFFYGNNITMKTDLQKPIESITVNGIQHKFPQFIFILCNLISILRYIRYIKYEKFYFMYLNIQIKLHNIK